MVITHQFSGIGSDNTYKSYSLCEMVNNFPVEPFLWDWIISARLFSEQELTANLVNANMFCIPQQPPSGMVSPDHMFFSFLDIKYLYAKWEFINWAQLATTSCGLLNFTRLKNDDSFCVTGNAKAMLLLEFINGGFAEPGSWKTVLLGEVCNLLDSGICCFLGFSSRNTRIQGI